MNWLPLVYVQAWLSTAWEFVVVMVAGDKILAALQDAVAARQEAIVAKLDTMAARQAALESMMKAIASEANANMREQIGYLKGHAEGAQWALDAIEAQARKRFEETRDGDGVYPVDVIRAKRGMLH